MLVDALSVAAAIGADEDTFAGEAFALPGADLSSLLRRNAVIMGGQLFFVKRSGK